LQDTPADVVKQARAGAALDFLASIDPTLPTRAQAMQRKAIAAAQAAAPPAPAPQGPAVQAPAVQAPAVQTPADVAPAARPGTLRSLVIPSIRIQ
jgi:hypothetical protein